MTWLSRVTLRSPKDAFDVVAEGAGFQKKQLAYQRDASGSVVLGLRIVDSISGRELPTNVYRFEPREMDPDFKVLLLVALSFDDLVARAKKAGVGVSHSSTAPFKFAADRLVEVGQERLREQEAAHLLEGASPADLADELTPAGAVAAQADLRATRMNAAELRLGRAVDACARACAELEAAVLAAEVRAVLVDEPDKQDVRRLLVTRPHTDDQALTPFK
jgi:hypothetical protein